MSVAPREAESSGPSPSIHFPCGACGSGVFAAPAAREARCDACGRAALLSPGADVSGGGPVSRCAVCGADAFYAQKDFNRRLGAWLVAGAAAASLAIFAWSGLAALAFLGAVTLLDAALYRALPLVSVCYGCGAIYRGFTINPDHGAFDLHLFEVYETKADKRKAAADGGKSP